MKYVSVKIDFSILQSILKSYTEKLNISEFSDREIEKTLDFIGQEKDFHLEDIARPLRKAILFVAQEETEKFLEENEA